MNQLIRWIGIWAIAIALAGAHVAASAADNQLDISSSQKDQLKALASNTRDRTSRERDDLRQARADLVKTYCSYTIDWHKLNATWEKISSAQMTLLNIHLDNEIAIRNILKAEQFKALREMMKRRLRDRDVHFVAPPELEVLDRLPDKAMLDAMGVSEDKQKQLAESSNGRAVQELKESSKQLLDLYSSYSLDSGTARKLIATVHQKQTWLLKQQTHRQVQIRKILTQDQFQKLVQEIQKKMAERGLKRWSKDGDPENHNHPKADSKP